MKLKCLVSKLIMLSLIMNLSGRNTFADSPTPSPSPTPKITCNQIIQACDAALAAKNDTIEKKDRALQLADLAIQHAQDDTVRSYNELNELKESQNNIWHNPFLWVAVGLIGGILVRGLAK